MADLSDEEKKKQLLEEQLKIQKEIANLEYDRLGFSASLVDSLKEVMGIKSSQTTFDQTTLKVNKQLHKAILDQKSDLSNIKGIEKDILKNKLLIEKVTKVEQSLNKTIGKEGQKKVNSAAMHIKIGQLKSKQLQEELAKSEQGKKIDLNRIKTLREDIKYRDGMIDQSINGLGILEQQALYTSVQVDEAEAMVKEDEKRLKVAKEIEKNMGVTGGLLAGMGALLSKIPGATKVFGDAASDAKEEMIAIHKTTGKVPGKLQGATIAAKHLGKSLVKAFTSPTAIFLFLVKQMLALDKAVVDMQRSMGLSKDEAIGVNQQLASAAANSDTAYVSLQKMQKAMAALGEATGITNQRSDKIYETFVRLTEGMGLSAKEAGKLEMITKATGKDFEKSSLNAALTGVNLARQNGLMIDGRKLLKEVANISGQISANFGNDPEAIGKAVVQAKLLGTTLEAVAKIGQSLLNFEQSIEAEMEAELLIGKELNLERARALALTGSQGELAEELVDQVGSLAEFSDMNVIQQNKLAAAMGMSSDEMAEMLIQQEYQNASAQDLRDLGYEELAQRMEVRDLTQQMADLVDKLSTKFMALAAGPLGSVAKLIGSILDASWLIYGVTGMIAGLYVGKMVGGILTTIGQMQALTAVNVGNATAATAGATAMSLGAMAPVILAAVAGVGALLYSFYADDMSMSAAGKSGYGEQMLVGPKGSISLNNNDTVVGLPGGEIIAGTDLFSGGNEVTSAGTQLSAADIVEAVVAGVSNVTVEAQTKPASLFGEFQNLSQISMGGAIA